MSVRRVLMLCYHYPPANNGGVERSHKFAGYLPVFGWETLVLTTNLHGAPSDQTGVTFADEPLSLYRRLFKKKVASPSVTSVRPAKSSSGLNSLFRKWLIPDV